MKIVLIGSYHSVIRDKATLPLQLRFKPNNMIEYHIENTSAISEDKKQALIGIISKWFTNLKILEEIVDKE